MTKCSFAVIAVLAIPMLFGCEHKRGMITSLEDITTENQRVGLLGGIFGNPQRRLVGINGLLPYSDVATGFYYQKQSGPPSTAIGIASPGQPSFMVVRHIPYAPPPPGTPFEQLVAIRDNIRDVQLKAAAYVAARIRLSDMIARDAPDTAITAANTEVATAQGAYDVAYSKAVKSINVPGIMVFRWQTTNQRSLAAAIGDIFSGNVQRTDESSGFVVVGGLRVATLVAGDDVCDIPGRGKRLVTTYAMQAEHLLYSTEADLSELLQAELKASPSQFKNLGATLLAADKIEIKLVLARVQSLANQANMSGMTIRTEPVNWTVELAIAPWVTASSTPSVTANPNPPSTYAHPFYVVNMRLSDLQQIVCP